MYIKRDEQVTYAVEDYIFKCLYTYDEGRIEKCDIKYLLGFYALHIECESEFISIDDFTDWVHELEDNNIKNIIKEEIEF